MIEIQSYDSNKYDFNLECNHLIWMSVFATDDNCIWLMSKIMYDYNNNKQLEKIYKSHLIAQPLYFDCMKQSTVISVWPSIGS